VIPSEHIVGLPDPHETMSQSCVPATPAFWQVTRHQAPAGQVEWQGPLPHAKRQTLPGAHAQSPSAQVPSQRGLSPSQVTWHGGAPQAKSQLAPVAQVQSPLEQVPSHDEPALQSTWHGGAAHEKLQLSWAAQTQLPLEQSARSSWWQAVARAKSKARQSGRIVSFLS
jgi:hypothetical protein